MATDGLTHPCRLQRVDDGGERGRVLHGVTRDLWQAAFDAHVAAPNGTPDEVQPAAAITAS